MKGYYVIGRDDPIEIVGRNAKARAIKKAQELKKIENVEIIVQKFDDANPNGYMANEEYFVI